MEIEQRIRKIVENSSNLLERLHSNLFEPDIIQDEDIIEKRLHELNQVVAKGNQEKFNKFLECYGLSEASFKRWLGSVHLKEEAILPSWVETLREILTCTKTISEDLKPPLIEPENPLPFEDILLPFVFRAQEKLENKLNFSSKYLGEILSKSAWLGLQRQLLKELSTLSAAPLYQEFKVNNSLPILYNFIQVVAKPGENNQVYYHSFVKKILTNEGLLAFFEKYPVLAKLIALRIDFWIKNIAEFIERLKNDWLAISKTFGNINQVIDIKPGLSDSHNNGHSVIALTCDCGLKLIYKPKNFDLEVAYNQLLQWLNNLEIPFKFKILTILNRNQYAWLEYIYKLPCESEVAVKTFYQKAGMLLCLFYLLDSVDCIQDNFIASGEDFIFIDQETILHNKSHLKPDEYKRTEIFESVMATHFLPRWTKYNKKIYYDISALGGWENQTLIDKYPFWYSINTDYMHIKYEKYFIEINDHIPRLNQSILFPNDYSQEIITGFRKIYKIFNKNKKKLLDKNSPLNLLLFQKNRYLMRNTNSYVNILGKSLSPNLLKSGIDRSIGLNVLSRPILTSENQRKNWDVFLAEIKAMEQLDIPYLMNQANSYDLITESGHRIENYFEDTISNKIIRNIENLSEEDLQKQIYFIEGSLWARKSRLNHDTQLITPTTNEANIINFLSKKELIEQANKIAEKILSRRIKQEKTKNYSWISLGNTPHTNLLELTFLKDNIFDGQLGIALFFAALARVTDCLELYKPTNALIKNLLNNSKLTQQLTNLNDIGAATGLGSIIYSLVKISQFIQEKQEQQTINLLEYAAKLANLITSELLETEKDYNIMTGAAGAILGLLALYQETSSQKVLERAIACGDYLLKHPIWQTKDNDKHKYSGFLQGVGGIAYSLLRLYEVTNNNSYLERAIEGINYERDILTQANQYNWCHGVAGIGLVFLDSLTIIDNETMRQNIHLTLEMTQNYGISNVDDLCCGNMGRVEFLLVASQKLDDSRLWEKANQLATMVVTRAQERGKYQIYPNLPDSLYLPGFFKGSAGIGYQLLRLAYPSLLPSILLFS